MTERTDVYTIREMVSLAELVIRLKEYRYAIFNALIWILFGVVYAALYLVLVGLELYILQIGMTSILSTLSGLYPIVPLVVSLTALAKVMKSIRVEYEKKEGKVFAVVFALYFTIIYTVLSIVFSIVNFWKTKLGTLIAAYMFSTVWYPTLGLCFLTIYLLRRREIKNVSPFYPNDFRLSGIAILASSPLPYIPLIKFLVSNARPTTGMLYYMPISGGSIATGLMLGIYACVAIAILVSSVRLLYVKKEQ